MSKMNGDFKTGKSSKISQVEENEWKLKIK